MPKLIASVSFPPSLQALPPNILRSLVTYERVHHQAALTPLIEQWQKTQRLPTALVLVGHSLLGKTEAAQTLAEGFLQTDSPVPQPLSPSCWKVLFQPKKEEIEDLKRKALLQQPAPGFWICLPSSHQLLGPATAALLKILEEPPPRWTFLLTAPDLRLLPAALASRCQTVFLRPFSPPELEAALTELYPKHPSLPEALFLAQGSLRRAVMSLQPEAVKRRQQLQQVFQAPEPLFALWENWSSSEEDPLLDRLPVLAQCLHSLLRASLEQPAFSNPPVWPEPRMQHTLFHYATQAQNAFPSLAALRSYWIEGLELLHAFEQAWQAHANRKRLWQSFFLYWLSLWAKLGRV